MWAALKRCCEEVLNGWDRLCVCHVIGDFEGANHILFSNDLTLVSGELDSIVDASGMKYTVEKYCYSTPSNMEGAATEGGSRFGVSIGCIVESADAKGNNKFRFRVGAVRLGVFLHS